VKARSNQFGYDSVPLVKPRQRGLRACIPVFVESLSSLSSIRHRPRLDCRTAFEFSDALGEDKALAEVAGSQEPVTLLGG
jgi:hypothetical protein